LGVIRTIDKITWPEIALWFPRALRG
jgi:hypothetical protein